MKMLQAAAVLVLGASFGVDAAPSVRMDVYPSNNPTYEKECGACHFAYQAGWLPERSWRKIVANLKDHFGESIDLTPAARDAVLAHLSANAADHVDTMRSRELLAGIGPGDTPTSITKVLYVGGIHGGFLDPVFKGKPEVKTLAHCPACHPRAERGIFWDVYYRITDAGFRK
jgi:hypothetical protein